MPAESVDGPEGRALWARADRVLVGGGIYRSRSADMVGRGILPGFVAAADGCRVTDADGRDYIDLMGANGPNILGYRHPEVEAAADAVRRLQTTASLFPTTLVDVVERVVEAHPTADWGVVAKNGSEVVSLGVRVARNHTGRRAVVAFENAYHGNDPELALGPPPGPLTEITDDVHRLPWNGAQALVDHAERHAGDLAAIVLNPLHQSPGVPTVEADADFVAAIEQVRERHGLVLVFDDVRHGMRLDPVGSYRRLGLEPELVALGKALGNGHSISALVGTDEVRRAARRIMFTATYMFEAPPMAAAITTLDVFRRDRVFDHVEAMGRRLVAGIGAAAVEHGQRIELTGPAAMPSLRFTDDPDGRRVRTFARRAALEGAILHPLLNWNLSLAHTEADIDRVIEIAGRAMADLDRAPG